MVLKEETADVVSFRESASGEQMPRVQAGSGPRRRRDRAWLVGAGGALSGGEASQMNATSRLTGTRASESGCEIIVATPNEPKRNTWAVWRSQ
jgi:hypothetical protein